MTRRWLHIAFLMIPLSGWAQYEGEQDYAKEFIWGITKNTNSGLIAGLVLRHSRILKESNYESFGLEIVNVKHPKEQRYTSQQSGTSYIWGKQNYLYAFRLQYGRERILFKKAPQQGVQIGVNAAAGPTIGIEAPYYILTNGGEYVQYDPDLYNSLGSIQGSGKFLQGIGESAVVPGLNLKTGISFEFGAFRNNVAGVEIGFAAEVYTRKIVLVPTQKNRAAFGSAFFTFFWGTRK